jgi:hypothetical protein
VVGFVKRSQWLFYFAFAAGVGALAGNLDGVLVFFAVGAAILFGGHAGTGSVGALFRIGHGVLLGRPIDPTAMLAREAGTKVAVLIRVGK